MRKGQYVLASLLFGISVSSYAFYNPDHLAQFNLTNQCNNCDLSGSTLSGNHSGAVISTSNLTGSIGLGTFASANFSGSNLSSSNWSTANLSYAQLAFIPLIKANFTGAELSYANFDGANTNDAIFDNANLYGSNISQQQLSAAKSYCGATLSDGTKKNC